MALTDLTGTTWLMNETADCTALFTQAYWSVSGDTDSTDGGTTFLESFTGIGARTEVGPKGTRYISFLVDTSYEYWYVGSYTTPVTSLTMDQYATVYIRITGGTDATNSTLIAWFEANGTQIIQTITQNISYGSSTMTNSWWGTNSVSKMYWGDTLVWERDGYVVTLTNGNIDNVAVYDGQDNTGTNLGILLMGESAQYVIKSGYIYAEWDDPYTQSNLSFSESGTILGNPLRIISDKILTIVEIPILTSYITFSSANSFNLATSIATKNWNGTMYYSTDKTRWNIWDGTTTIVSQLDGNRYAIYVGGSGNTIITGINSTYRWLLSGTATSISCSGNLESLLDYATVYAGNHPTMANYCFAYLFYGQTKLTSAPDLLATSVSQYGCAGMYQGCTNLLTAPTLSPTTLADHCYYYMFYNCNKMTTTPVLPATTLASYCYSYMFTSCKKLTTPPDIPATTFKGSCCGYMFSGCTSLTRPCKIAGGTTQATPAKTCCQYMYNGCTALNIYTTSSGHTAVYKGMTYSTTSSASNYNSTYRMFYNCYVDGVKSTANFLTAGTQYYY